MTAGHGSRGRRRLGAWGFEGERYPPPASTLEWLAARLGPANPPAPRVDLRAAELPEPRSLPELPVVVGAERQDRWAHARGQGLTDLLRLRAGRVPAAPDAVARPVDAGEVAATLAACAAAGVRVIPWGGGTSVTGGVNPLPGARPVVTLDLAALEGLEMLDETSGLATFGAGTSGPALEEALGARGLTLGHFPQSWELSTLGGWIATRASGQESLGYGSIQDLVAGVEVVAPGGRLRLPALPAAASGPDLRQVVLGSEGRLGVITRATVRVRPRPAQTRVEALLVPTWSAGLDAARDLLRARVPLTLLRLSDAEESEVAMTLGLGKLGWAERWVRAYLRMRGVGDRPCLMLCGAAGSGRAAGAALRRAHAVLRPHGAVGLGRAPGRKWLAERFRHPYLRDALLDAGYATDTLETAAPWSALPALTGTIRHELVEALESEGERVVALCHLSHPYPDGASLYYTFFYRCPDDVEEAIERWARIKGAATEAIAAAGAALSHHHGIGGWHAPWLEREIGADGRRLLEAMVRDLDPTSVLNPGVLLGSTDRLRE